MRQIAIAAAVAAPVIGVALIPGNEQEPSGLKMLSLLPSGLAGSCATGVPRQPSLEVTVPRVAGAVDVTLCGVCHVEPESATAAAALVNRRASHGLRTVALECDAHTLELLRCASSAIKGMSRERVRDQGLGAVRDALFRSETARGMLQRASGKSLQSAAQVGIPATLARHISRDGVLWSDEMRTAADAADEAGARVVCLGEQPRPNAVSPPFPVAPSLIGLAACWLRARALQPGLDELSCEANGVAAANAALRERVPEHYARLVTRPDERMAKRLIGLCAELGRQTRGGDETTQTKHDVGHVVVVVGAQHVPGLQHILSRSAASVPE
jgi:hypothetical protein